MNEKWTITNRDRETESGTDTHRSDRTEQHQQRRAETEKKRGEERGEAIVITEIAREESRNRTEIGLERERESWRGNSKQ